jgi:hypothetical protein
MEAHMAEETFSTNVMRLIAAELHFQSVLSASREMFGRSYFSLGPIEKQSIEQTVIGIVANNFQTLTPEFLAGQEVREPMGFRVPTEPPAGGKTR